MAADKDMPRAIEHPLAPSHQRQERRILASASAPRRIPACQVRECDWGDPPDSNLKCSRYHTIKASGLTTCC